MGWMACFELLQRGSSHGDISKFLHLRIKSHFFAFSMMVLMFGEGFLPQG
jgi:hypothetical protein